MPERPLFWESSLRVCHQTLLSGHYAPIDFDLDALEFGLMQFAEDQEAGVPPSLIREQGASINECYEINGLLVHIREMLILDLNRISISNRITTAQIPHVREINELIAEIQANRDRNLIVDTIDRLMIRVTRIRELIEGVGFEDDLMDAA